MLKRTVRAKERERVRRIINKEKKQNHTKDLTIKSD